MAAGSFELRGLLRFTDAVKAFKHLPSAASARHLHLAPPFLVDDYTPMAQTTYRLGRMPAKAGSCAAVPGLCLHGHPLEEGNCRVMYYDLYLCFLLFCVFEQVQAVLKELEHCMACPRECRRPPAQPSWAVPGGVKGGCVIRVPTLWGGGSSAG